MTERFEPARKGNLKDLAVVVAIVENMTVNRLSTDLNPSFAALQVV